MTLKSMTGFGRTEGTSGSVTWIWEARSVNGRGLDIRLRLPPGLDGLESKVRERIQGACTRGSVAVTLTMKRQETSGEIRINPQALAAIADAIRQLREAIPGPTSVNLDGLLALRGVLDTAEAEDDVQLSEVRNHAILASLDGALQDMVAGRAAEGERLARVIAAQVADVATLVAEVAAAPARAPAAIALRLRDQIARLTGDAGAGLDPARLHQEAMLMATRIDVDEELKRLTAHIAAARDLLQASEPIGRKFDFLTQEFNREANTLCSKANDADITRAGLSLKAVIDQMREQVQNIE